MKKRYFVYILEAGDGKFYTGYTNDLKKRMEDHKRGRGAKFTRGFGFRKLLYHEEHPTKSSAMRREAGIKALDRAQKEELVRRAKNAAKKRVRSVATRA